MAKYTIIALRILMGSVFFINGFDKIYPLLPTPNFAPPAQAFYGALMSMEYFLLLLGLAEFLAGILLITNQFVPFALAILAPIITNILLFHLFLDLQGLPLALFLLISEVILLYFYRSYFATLLSRKSKF